MSHRNSYPIRARLSACALGALLALSLAQGAGAAAPASPGPSVAWLAAAGDADVERAFAQARSDKKPVLLYWGAKWCPPCNQLKATLFNRQDFIEQSRAIVAVNIDGDLPGAQKLGTRFKVRGYPTMILFNADGAELTRLPGEVDAAQVLQVLQLGMAGGRPIKTVLDDARAGKPLSANEWKLLAFYSWETDEQQLVPPAELPALLAQLAAASPANDPSTTTRLWLKALAASNEGRGVKPDTAIRERVLALLADPAAARVQMDVLVYGANDIVLTLVGAGADKKALLASYDAALQKLQADASLSRADRISALTARIELARIDQPKEAAQVQIPAPLLASLREHVARDDREISDGYERQAVITSDAYALGQAGLWAESDALLKASLTKSHSPYYLMSQLGGNAKKQGRKDEALKWYAEAFNKSEGPATRLQWGSSYLTALVELAPQDAARIEKTAAQLLNEAAQDKGAFYERSARSLQRVGAKLNSWNSGGQHAPALKRLQTQLDGVCAKLPAGDPQRATCEGVLKPGAKKAG
jgi:thioredoxin-related protein